MTQPADLGVRELLDAFASGAASPAEALGSCLDRIQAVDGRLKAVMSVHEERARRAAARSTERWRAGEARALDGVPFGVKDVIDVAGLPTTGGSTIHGRHAARSSATAVRRLEEAGAVLVAKLHTAEFAMGDDAHFGPTLNPWDPARVTGGSSTGSAVAVAARELPFALGTDSGGSIRCPAAYCGVTGLKPTFGLVPRTGVWPLSWTLDHVGPLGRSASDVALVLDAIRGYDPADAYSARTAGRPGRPDRGDPREGEPGLRGTRVALPTDWLFDVVDDDVRAAIDAAVAVLEGLGAVIVEAPLPHAHLADTICWTVMFAEMASLHADTFARIAEYGPKTGQLLVDARFVSAADYLRALRAIPLVQSDFTALFERADALLAPGMPTAAPPVSQPGFRIGDVAHAWEEVVSRTTSIFNVVGIPALAVPVGFDGAGMPLGMQVAARPGADALCLRIGRAFQAATDHHRRAPSQSASNRTGKTS
jgi:aspartyl-tRNA(Asn)/glutamyl-tRNA(Gln) amidotransferase subunit A